MRGGYPVTQRFPFSKLLARLRQQGGQSLVEVTLGFLFFYTVLMAIVEFSHILYTKINLQHAVAEAGRYMVTGQGLDPLGLDPNKRLMAVQDKFCKNLVATGFSCSDVSSHFSFSCAGGCSQPVGGPGQTVTLTVTYQKGWFTGMFGYLLPSPITLTANTTWKNENYL
jgi:Flp pilus assembly protein TadG